MMTNLGISSGPDQQPGPGQAQDAGGGFAKIQHGHGALLLLVVDESEYS